MTTYRMICEISVTVEFTYDVDPGYAGDRTDPPQPPSVHNLQATVVGSKGERLVCPPWLADVMLAEEGEESLLIAAQEARDDALYDAAKWGRDAE
jgi:hypothetical protein